MPRFLATAAAALMATTAFLPLKTVHAEKLSVMWGQVHFPPSSIVTGKDAGTGFMDRQLDLIIEKLPQYEHKKVPMSVMRLLEMMQKGEQICFPSLQKNPAREAFIDFSPFLFVNLSNGLIINAANRDKYAPYLKEDGTADFGELVASGQFTFKYHDGKSYTAEIDSVLKRFKDQKSDSLLQQQGNIDRAQDLKQLEFGRVDAVLGRLIETLAFAREQGKGDLISFIPVSAETPYDTIHVGCAKGDWNKDFMKDLAKAATEIREDEDFVNSYMGWVPTDLVSTQRGFHKEALSRE
ncbi:TIGR02285 family protein [Sneathiella chinensis]|uniref:Solute-binding protein family 3/N-terminal domain-containing protein n=1 Tax=Sneathiella chinensis TaxID=349750 RepID=A0ABQ5U9G7_9PROT|nr:TIGR02285 family protein [Sneathiella chinensis]GLQ07151.1 hypothetical protein GCM10007924_23720 [Sneathiella chinensis]